MTYTVNDIGGGKQAIAIDFADEGVQLQGNTSILGGEVQARQYVPVFEADLRRANSHLFPVEAPENHEPMEG